MNMRVMLDTNVLISALLFPSARMNRLFEVIVIDHTLVISSYVIEELHKVVERKFPGKVDVIENLLSRMSYELVYTPKNITGSLVSIRDAKDYPVIYTAIMEAVDVLITGDKDFEELGLDKPEILTPNGFLERYGDGRGVQR